MTDLWALLLRPSEDKSAPKGAKTAAAALLLPPQQLLLLLLQLHLLLAQLGLTAKPSYHPPRRLKLLQLYSSCTTGGALTSTSAIASEENQPFLNEEIRDRPFCTSPHTH